MIDSIRFGFGTDSYRIGFVSFVIRFGVDSVKGSDSLQMCFGFIWIRSGFGSDSFKIWIGFGLGSVWMRFGFGFDEGLSFNLAAAWIRLRIGLITFHVLYDVIC